MPFFLWGNSGLIICLYYNYMRTRSYNNYKNPIPENLFKRYETFPYNSPSNKCKTKTTKLHSNETHLQKHTLSKEDQHLIQLVKRSISGDADAFLELMEKNSLAMYKVARGILDNDEDAADAMQDTILTCFEKIHTLKNPEYFKTWMIRILINECNKIHRHYKNFSRAEELPEVPGQDMSIEEFEFKEMLGMLDESYRVILVRYYVLESFRRGAKRGLQIVIGTVPVFLMAGFIEGFITRHTELPDMLRLGIILTSLAFIIFYYIYLPNRKKHGITET